MMTVRVRVAAMVARWAWRERKQPLQPVSRLPMRCVITDLDVNLHMNNSRYLAIMDVGRYHFMLVSGLGNELMWRRKWRPVLVRAEVDYKKSLKPGERFILETSLETVGNKSAVLLQRFWRGDVLVAEGRVTALFLHQGKSQSLQSLMADFAHLLPDETVPATT